MEVIDEILEKLINLLEREKILLINALNDNKASEEILSIVEEKQSLLSKLASYKEEDFKNLNENIKEKLNYIKELLTVNQTIASSNLNLIEEIFEAIFQPSSTYSTEGESKKTAGSLLNKKI